MPRSCLRKHRVVCASQAVSLPLEYPTLTFPHPVGRHEVLTHVSRSALSHYPSPFCSHIAFRMAPGDMGSLVIRTPMAWEMALARAARGG